MTLDRFEHIAFIEHRHKQNRKDKKVQFITKEEAKKILMVGETNFYRLLNFYPQMQVRKGLFNKEIACKLFETINQHKGVNKLLKIIKN